MACSMFRPVALQQFHGSQNGNRTKKRLGRHYHIRFVLLSFTGSEGTSTLYAALLRCCCCFCCCCCAALPPLPLPLPLLPLPFLVSLLAPSVLRYHLSGIVGMSQWPSCGSAA